MEKFSERVNYEVQFNQVYRERLEKLRPHIARSLGKLGEDALPVIVDAEKKKGESCAIVATLFIISDLKPCIFDRLDRKSKKLREVNRLTYYSRDIKYFVEDQSGRIELEFADVKKIYKEKFVLATGMCLGLVGSLTEKGRFLVSDVVLPFDSLENRRAKEAGSDRKACFISGLMVGQSNKNRERLLAMVGFLGSMGIDEYVLLGNIFDAESPTMLKELDALLKKMGGNITLIPDLGDLDSRALPLAPPHPKLFRTPTRPMYNPCRLSISGQRFLITTSFVIEDLLRYLPQNAENIQGTQAEYKMHINEQEIGHFKPKDLTHRSKNMLNGMRTLLSAGHICPTAPDTLVSSPCDTEDMFILNKEVDYFCVGGTEKFDSEVLKELDISLFTLPSFDRTGEVVVLDLKDGHFEIMRFDADEF
jgi:DNA polymerase delta subunit 2